MMTNASETVRDEVAQMAYVARECAKVKAECEREMAAKDAEIARMKKALNDIIEVSIRPYCAKNYFDIQTRCEDAQRIMKEGEAK